MQEFLSFCDIHMIELGDVLAFGLQPWPRYDGVRRSDKLTTCFQSPANTRGLTLNPDWHCKRAFFTANMRRIHRCSHISIAKSVPRMSPTTRYDTLSTYSAGPSRGDDGSESVGFAPHLSNHG